VFKVFETVRVEKVDNRTEDIDHSRSASTFTVHMCSGDDRILVSNLTYRIEQEVYCKIFPTPELEIKA